PSPRNRFDRPSHLVYWSAAITIAAITKKTRSRRQRAPARSNKLGPGAERVSDWFTISRISRVSRRAVYVTVPHQPSRRTKEHVMVQSAESLVTAERYNQGTTYAEYLASIERNQ